jgi:hypothetical protein
VESNRIALPVVDAAQAIGVGRSTLYALMRAGDVESVHIAGRRVVPIASLQAYVDRLRAEQNGTR